MKRAALLCVALARCTCDPPLSADGGYACSTDLDCAEGFFCLRGGCAALGTDAGVPDAGALIGGLAFTTPPRTQVVARCSAELGFSLVDDAGQVAPAPFDFPVALSSNGGLSFFSDSTCATPATQLTVPKGSSAGTFHFIGASPGAYDVTLSAPPLASATQTQTLVDAGLDQLVFATPQPAVVLAGTCIGPITVQVQDSAGNPELGPPGGKLLTLNLTPFGLNLYADAQCTMLTSTTQTTLAPGDTGVTFWASSATGGTYTIQVDGMNVMGASQRVTLGSMVHTGRCDMNGSTLTRTCNVTPAPLDLSRTFLLYQATGKETLVERVETTCLLNSSAAVTCVRSGSGGPVSIAWQTVEVAGAHVDHYTSACLADGGLSQSIALNSAVPASSVFTLVNTNAHGTDPNANDFFSVDNDGTQLNLQWEIQCEADNIDLQVVQVPGAAVVRTSGSVGMGSLTDTQQVSNATAGGFFVLGTWRTDAPVGAPSLICDRLMRAEAMGQMTLNVSRGANSGDAQCSGSNITGYNLERVDLGARAHSQQLVVSMDPGTAVSMVSINAVDVSRAFVLAPGQSGGVGQAVGEGAFTTLPDGGSPLGDVSATLQLTSPTQLQVSRGTSNDSAVFTVYVVELEP